MSCSSVPALSRAASSSSTPHLLDGFGIQIQDVDYFGTNEVFPPPFCKIYAKIIPEYQALEEMELIELAIFHCYNTFKKTNAPDNLAKQFIKSTHDLLILVRILSTHNKMLSELGHGMLSEDSIRQYGFQLSKTMRKLNELKKELLKASPESEDLKEALLFFELLLLHENLPSRSRLLSQTVNYLFLVSPPIAQVLTPLPNPSFLDSIPMINSYLSFQSELYETGSPGIYHTFLQDPRFTHLFMTHADPSHNRKAVKKVWVELSLACTQTESAITRDRGRRGRYASMEEYARETSAIAALDTLSKGFNKHLESSLNASFNRLTRNLTELVLTEDPHADVTVTKEDPLFVDFLPRVTKIHRLMQEHIQTCYLNKLDSYQEASRAAVQQESHHASRKNLRVLKRRVFQHTFDANKKKTSQCFASVCTELARLRSNFVKQLKNAPVLTLDADQIQAKIHTLTENLSFLLSLMIDLRILLGTDTTSLVDGKQSYQYPREFLDLLELDIDAIISQRSPVSEIASLPEEEEAASSSSAAESPKLSALAPSSDDDATPEAPSSSTSPAPTLPEEVVPSSEAPIAHPIEETYDCWKDVLKIYYPEIFTAETRLEVLRALKDDFKFTEATGSHRKYTHKRTGKTISLTKGPHVIIPTKTLHFTRQSVVESLLDDLTGQLHKVHSDIEALIQAQLPRGGKKGPKKKGPPIEEQIEVLRNQALSLEKQIEGLRRR